MKINVAEFEAKFGMVQIFGAIDGTHIPIIAPFTNSQNYYNCKCFHSLNVPAVYDYCALFLDIDCRWPGSVHDAKCLPILGLTKIAKFPVAKNLPICFVWHGSCSKLHYY